MKIRPISKVYALGYSKLGSYDATSVTMFVTEKRNPQNISEVDKILILKIMCFLLFNYFKRDST